MSYEEIFDKVFESYAAKDSWSLSSITHGEYSWQKAREGYGADEPCNVEMEVEDIRKDAERIKIRRLLLNGISKFKR